jgi:aminoglycoside phosphotransferase (APT) family kinase protein
MTRQPEVKRFTAALDAHLMGPRLSDALSTGHRPCHVLDAKYEPGIRASVLYQHGADLIRGDLLAPDSPPGSGRVTGWPGMNLSVYPYDPDLPTLPLAISGTVMGPRISQLSSGLTPIQRRAFSRRCQVTLLRYRLGKRATVRLGTPVDGPSYVAKIYHDPAKAAAVAHEAQALALIAARDGGLRLAPTIGHLPEISAVVQQSISGQPVDSLLLAPGWHRPAVTEAVRLAASALAQLHRGPMVSTRLRPVAKELHRFRARSLRICAVDPQQGDQLLGVAERLLETFDALPDSPPGVVHGDCKPSQFILSDDGAVYLLDFDHCGVSDQAGDAGTFVATLRQLAVQRTLAGASAGETTGFEALAEKFITTYCESMEDNLSTRIRWHEVVALQRKALRSFARSPRSPLSTALVEESHRCLDRLTQELS